MTSVETINLEDFAAAANKAFEGTGLDGWYDPRVIQCGAQVSNLEIMTETGREAIQYGEDDFDFTGTSCPSQAAFDAAKALAEDFGLSVHWFACEKGLGSFSFRVPRS